MKTILTLILALLVNAAFAEDPPPTLPLVFTAKEVKLDFVERSHSSKAIPPRTLAARSFQFDQPKEFTVSWKVDSGRLLLDTPHSKGPVLELPPGFVADVKKLADDSWQVGTFVREGTAMAIILTTSTK